MKKIISSLGTKGGTGKSSLIFAVLALLNNLNSELKYLVFNCDSSSATIPLLIENSNTDIRNTTVLNIDDFYLPSFVYSNEKFISNFDYLLVDLKGEELREKDIIKLFELVDIFMVPIIPSMAGTSAIIGLIDKVKYLKLPLEKIFIFFNLFGYTETSTYYLGLKENLTDYIKETAIRIIDQPLLAVQNLEDKKSSSILSSRKNMILLHEFIEEHIL